MAYKSRGFIQTGGLLKAKIRAATETRGFAETRLLTNWKDIAGPATASICRPVKVSYGKQGFGATGVPHIYEKSTPKLCESGARKRDAKHMKNT